MPVAGAHPLAYPRPAQTIMSPTSPSRPAHSRPHGWRLRSGTTVPVAGALLVSALFGLNLAHHAVAGTLCCADDAFTAVAAKNLATGQGYASSYAPAPDGALSLVPFDPLITTGPVLVVPAALGVFVFGNQYWVPGAAAVAVHLLLLAAVFVHLGRTEGGDRRWAAAVVLAVVALNLATLGHYEQWYTLLGEVAALLLLCLAVLWSLDGDRRRGRYAMAGLLVGLACLAKLLALLALPVVLASVALHAARSQREPSSFPRLARGLGAAIVAFACFCLPLALFEAGKLADLGLQGYLENKERAAWQMKASPGSGLTDLADGATLARLRETTLRNWRALTAFFGAAWPAASYLAALALGLAARGRWTGRDSAAPLALTGIAAVYAAWWLSISGGARVRYLLIGLGVWCLGVVLDLVRGPGSVRKALLACAFALALLPRVTFASAALPRWPLFEASPRTEAMLETARFLEAERQGRRIAADWWATGVDMEYLLPGTGNLVSHLSLDREAPSPVLLVENAQWIDLSPGLRERWDAAVTDLGAELELERPPYRVYAAPPLSETVGRAP